MTELGIVKKEPSGLFRWTVLLVISLAMFGNYYIYDSISPLADLLIKQLNFTDSDIGLLQGIYSAPNLIMVLIGGIIIDRIGTRKSVLIFTSLVVLGALVTLLDGNIYTMASGRLLFGLGAESMIVAITTTIAKWFKGKMLSLAFGVNLMIARAGSFFALNSPTFARDLFDNWQDPLWLSFFAGVVAIVCILIYFVLDSIAEKKYTLGKEEAEKVEFKDMFNFSKSFWFISLLCVTFYSAVFPFQTFAVKFFQNVHLTGMPVDSARSAGGFLSSIITLSSMLLTPIFGAMVDLVGKRSYFMMLGSAIIIPLYLIMAYFVMEGQLPANVVAELQAGAQGSNVVETFFMQFWYLGKMIITLISYYPNIVIPMVILGLAFSLVPAVLWPSVAYVVDESKLGTAYGLMTMIQSSGLTFMNFMVGNVNDWTGGHTVGMWIFSSLGFFGLFFAFMLWKNERGPNGHGLDKAKQA